MPFFLPVGLSIYLTVSADSYPVAFRRRKRGDAEDFGKEIRGAQRVKGRTNSSVFPTILCVPPKATGYESGLPVYLLQQRSNETRKRKEQTLIFKLGTLDSMKGFHAVSKYIWTNYMQQIPTSGTTKRFDPLINLTFYF